MRLSPVVVLLNVEKVEKYFNRVFLTPALRKNYFPCRKLWSETILQMLIEAGSICSSCAISVIFTTTWLTLTSKSRLIRLNFEVFGGEAWGRMSVRSELNGGSSSVVLD